MKHANKVNTKYTAILGEDELNKGVYIPCKEYGNKRAGRNKN